MQHEESKHMFRFKMDLFEMLNRIFCFFIYLLFTVSCISFILYLQ